jgi:hypothetical protein
MGGGASTPDNSAQVAAAKAQQADLLQKNKENQMKKEAIASKATEDFNARRRGQTGRATLIKTSENGILGSIGKLGN